MNPPVSNSLELDGIKIVHRLDKQPASATIIASIPAKPLVQAKLKRGGFFICVEAAA